MPRFTVVMPARNSSATIGLAVKSVLRTFPRDTEVVVWDDASKDETSEVALRAGEGRVQIMSSSRSMGGGVARQKILAATDSEFVVNQDSDDVSLPWRYRLQSQLLEDADFAFTSTLRFSRWGPGRPSAPLPLDPSDVPIALLIKNPLPHPTMVARRAALADIGGYSGARLAQDYELWLRAARHGKRIRLGGAPGLAYRVSPTQVSRHPEYGRRLADNEQLVISYASLLYELLPSLGRRTSDVHDIEDLGKVGLEPLNALVGTMTPAVRFYYQQLLAAQRFGDIGSVVFKVRAL
ncbi:glycosyltransferase family 2 protein [Kocuria rhizosphaericola]|uniref:glycosyltransferase family 2 protein n=1 Tax=Kocuria rhizosphaericola TaxID=3376284 RepID=UPI00379B3441